MFSLCVLPVHANFDMNHDFFDIAELIGSAASFMTRRFGLIPDGSVPRVAAVARPGARSLERLDRQDMQTLNLLEWPCPRENQPSQAKPSQAKPGHQASPAFKAWGVGCCSDAATRRRRLPQRVGELIIDLNFSAQPASSDAVQLCVLDQKLLEALDHLQLVVAAPGREGRNGVADIDQRLDTHS